MNTEQPDNRFIITPVGHVESDIKEITFSPHGKDDPESRKKQIKKHREERRRTISTLTLLPRFAPLLDGIEEFSHIVVIYWPHLIPPEERNIQKVHPMGRKDIPLQGIFATRSPARPNPLLISTVQLLERKDNQLRVKGLEALDGSPILDIKPVTRPFDDGTELTFPQWITMVNRELEQDA